MPRDTMPGTAAAQQQAAAADDAFGADLYRLLAAGRRNVVFSPASIAAALQMARAGRAGQRPRRSPPPCTWPARTPPPTACGCCPACSARTATAPT